jgi:hypothetical protein
MNTKTVTKVIERKIKAFENDLNQLAEKVRIDVVKPFCDKNNLNFISGMGTWFFSVNDYPFQYSTFSSVGDIPYDWSTDENDPEKYKFDGVEEIINLLNTNVPSNFTHWGGSLATFGLYLNDYMCNYE